MLFRVRDRVSGREYTTAGFLDAPGGNKVRAVELGSGDSVKVEINKLDLDIVGEYKSITNCLEEKVILFDLAKSRFDYPNSDLEQEQGFNWV